MHDNHFCRDLNCWCFMQCLQERIFTCVNLQAQARVKELEAQASNMLTAAFHSQTVRQFESQITTLRTSIQQEQEQNRNLASELAQLKEQVASMEDESRKVHF